MPAGVARSLRVTALSDLGEGFDLHQEIRVGQLRQADRRALRRRRAEIALAQIGIFVEFDRLCDVADRKNNVLDCRAAGIKAGTVVLANLGRGRRSGARWPDDLRSRQIFYDLPILVGLANMRLRVFALYLQQIAVVC